MKMRTVGMCTDPECHNPEPHEDDQGTRFFGVPAWLYCFITVVGLGVALLGYTFATR